MNRLPIRLRLTLWYCAMFATAAALLSAASWWMLRRSLVATEYHELQERAEDVQLLLDPARSRDGSERLDSKSSLKFTRSRTMANIYRFSIRTRIGSIDRNAWSSEGLTPATPGDLTPKGTVVEFHQGTRYVRALSTRSMPTGMLLCPDGHRVEQIDGVAIGLPRPVVVADAWRC